MSISITPGSGAVVATDTASGAEQQIVKIAVGASGTATLMASGSGAASTATPRVILASDDPAVTALGAAGVAPAAGTGVLGWLRSILAAISATRAVDGVVDIRSLPAYTQAVSGPVTDAQLRATALPVAVTFPVTQAVSATSLPLPTGAATESSLGTIGTAPPTLPGSSTGIMGLLRWIGSLLTLGAGTATAAQRVVIATDQTAVPVYRPGVSYTDRSGTMTAGGTAQTLMAANANRKGWRIQNLSSADLWVNDKGATAIAAQPSFKLASGAAYESPAFGASTAAISILGATTGQSFEAMEA